MLCQKIRPVYAGHIVWGASADEISAVNILHGLPRRIRERLEGTYAQDGRIILTSLRIC